MATDETWRKHRRRSVLLFLTAARVLAASPASGDDKTDTVTVHHEPADTLEHASGSGSQVSETEIRRAQPQSSSELFRRVPSVVVRQEDGMGLRLNLGLRGLNPTRGRLVLLEEDDVPVVVSPYGEPELYWSTPIERIQHLEVLKGSEVVLHGPQTVGGVVKLSTWTPPSREEWSVEGDYGERSYGKALARYGNSEGDVRYVVQAFRKQGDGFRNMPFEATDVMTKVAFPTGKNGTATLKLAAYDELSHTTFVGLTQPMFQANPRQNNVAPDDTFGIRRYEASVAHEQRLSDRTKLRTTVFGYTMNLRIYQQDFDRGRVDGVGYSRIAGPEGIDGAALYFRDTRSLRDRTYDVIGIEPRLEHRVETGGVRHRIIVGTRFMVDTARRRLSRGVSPTAESGDLLTDDTTSILGMAAYLQDRIAFRDDLLVTPGVRVEHSRSHRTARRVVDPDGTIHDVDLEGESAATGVMPGIGMVFGKPVWNLFGGIHSGYSPPRVSQSITPTGADTGLAAERSVNYELGTRVRPLKWIRAEVTGFLTSFDNQLVSNNTLSGSTAEFKNGGRTRHLGAETTVTTQLGKGLRLPIDLDLAGQYTWARSTFVGGPNEGNFVPYSPQQLLAMTLDGEHKSGFGAQVSWTHVGSQFADELNSIEPDISGRSGQLAAYDVLDVGARYRHKPTGLSLHVTVKNALDNVYLSGRLPNGIFTSGFRQAIVGLKWSGP
jgi:Fe(3+) dicitrate transport protein